MRNAREAWRRPDDPSRPSTYEARCHDGRRAVTEADMQADDVRGLPDYGALRWALSDNAIKVPRPV